MKAFLHIFMVAFILVTTSAHATSTQATTTDPILKKDPKILILIITSSNMQAYIDLQDIWKQYMNSDPEHFEVYFITGNPDLATPYEIKGNYLITKTEESYKPGIINKSVLSIEALLPRLHEFDYVVRTNLSSFYVFPRLLNFVKTLPKEKCYCGLQMFIDVPKFGTINFISGAGIILSTDMAKLLVDEKNEVLKFNKELPDDLILGRFFQNKWILSQSAPRSDFPTYDDWIAKKDKIPQNAFHFRAKNHYDFRSADENFRDEIAVDKELLKMFYPKS